MKTKSFKFLATLLCVCLTLLAFAVLPQKASLASPAINNGLDPIVMIAVDETNQGSAPCTDVYKQNVGTPHETIAHYPCSAGTI